MSTTNDTAKRVKEKFPCLHNGRQHFMMKFPISCTTFLFFQPTHGDVSHVQLSNLFPSAPLAFHLPHHIRIISTFFSTNSQFSPVNHIGGDFILLCYRTTLHKLSVSLHPTSQCPYSYSNLNMTSLKECYNIFMLLHFVEQRKLRLDRNSQLGYWWMIL